MGRSPVGVLGSIKLNARLSLQGVPCVDVRGALGRRVPVLYTWEGRARPLKSGFPPPQHFWGLGWRRGDGGLLEGSRDSD